MQEPQNFKHLYELKPIVALNAFIHDTPSETACVKQWAKDNQVRINNREYGKKVEKVELNLLTKCSM